MQGLSNEDFLLLAQEMNLEKEIPESVLGKIKLVFQRFD